MPGRYNALTSSTIDDRISQGDVHSNSTDGDALGDVFDNDDVGIELVYDSEPESTHTTHNEPDNGEVIIVVDDKEKMNLNKQSPQADYFNFTLLAQEIQIKIIAKMSIASFIRFLQTSKANYDFCYYNLKVLPLEFTAAKIKIYEHHIHLNVNQGKSSKEAVVLARNNFLDRNIYGQDTPYSTLRNSRRTHKEQYARQVEDESTSMDSESGKIETNFRVLLNDIVKESNHESLKIFKKILEELESNQMDIIKYHQQRRENIESLINRMDEHTLTVDSFNRAQCVCVFIGHSIMVSLGAAVFSWMVAMTLSIVVPPIIGSYPNCYEINDWIQKQACETKNFKLRFGINTPIMASIILVLFLLIAIPWTYCMARRIARTVDEINYSDAEISQLTDEDRELLSEILTINTDLDSYFSNNGITIIGDIKTRLENFLSTEGEYNTSDTQLYNLPMNVLIKLIKDRIKEIKTFNEDKTPVEQRQEAVWNKTREYTDAALLAEKQVKTLFKKMKTVESSSNVVINIREADSSTALTSKASTSYGSMSG